MINIYEFSYTNKLQNATTSKINSQKNADFSLGNFICIYVALPNDDEE